MAEPKEFKLPDVGEGLTEADIVKWHVQPGDKVEVNQTIVEIETAKAVVELPCPYQGVVAELLVEEGQTVNVGTPIIAIDESGKGGPAREAGKPEAEEAAGVATPVSEPPARASALAEDMVPDVPAPKKDERQPVLVGYGVKLSATKRRPRKTTPSTQPAAESPAAYGEPLERPRAHVGRVAVLAKPPVRKLAKDLGVDLGTVTGTGAGGSITRADVEAAVRAGPAAPTAATPGVREERIPIKGVRKHTAAAMVASAFTAPHVTEFLQVDATETMEAARRLGTLPEFEGVRVSPLLLVAKALLLAVRRNPMINSSWDEQAQEIVVKHYVNLGIATATERGLIVPNIGDAHAKSLPQLASAIQELTETARAGKTQPADLTGGTITITNVGVFGVDGGTPILNPGEAAILCFGQIRDMPWVVDGELAVRKVCTLSLSFDHRIVDGELGSKVLRDVGAMLEEPMRMLAWG